MASIINASTSTGLVTTADTSGVLQLQTAGTTALTVDASQNVSAVGSLGTTIASKTAEFNAAGGSIYSSYNDGTKTWRTGVGIFAAGQFSIRNATDSLQAIDITSAGNVGIGTSSPSRKLQVIGSSLFTGNLLVNSASGSASISIQGQTSSVEGAWSIASQSTRSLVFTDDYQGLERMRIDSSGNLLLGLTSNGAAGAKFTIYAATGQEVLLTGASGTCIKFTNSQNLGGAISVASGGGTTYGTSSDYRLKHDIQPMTGALAKVAQLNPVTYKWNIDESESQGFIAHELQAVIPDAVVGEKDAVDSEGNPQYQNVDTSFLVATLTAAIKEQQAIITSLTDRITALEGTTP